jgi:endoglucanase
MFSLSARVRAAVMAALVLASFPRSAHADPLPDAPLFNRPFYIGAYLGDTDTRGEAVESGIGRFARMVGKRPAFVKTFHDLEVDFSERGWGGQLVRRTVATGSTPYLALDLRFRGAPSRGLLDAINAGRADAQLVRMARGLAGVRGTVLMAPGWEMNGRWNYAWQGIYNGEAAAPARYVAAYRHIVTIFRREGAHNVKWVFSPNVGNPLARYSAGPGHWNWYGHYYPGDQFVDYLGPHGYNGPSVWGGAYQTFATVFNGRDSDNILADLEARYPRKKIIIGEFASQEARGFDKGAWISEAFATLRQHRNVIGAIWFHTRKEADWRIDSSRTSVEAFRTVMRDPNVRDSFR